MSLPIRRPGGGGGFLNGVSGVLVDYEFAINKQGVTKKGLPYTTMSVKLTIQPDGGEPVDQFFDAGFIYGEHPISDDGKTIQGDERYALDGTTLWGQFVLSLVEGDGNRVPEDLLGDLRNYEALMGTRVTFSRVKDIEATKARGARKLGAKATTATEEALINAGKRQDKKDKTKSYVLDKLLVTEVVALPEGGRAKTVKKAVAKKAVAKVAAPAASEGDSEAADAAIKAVLEGADGALARTALSSAFVKYALSQKMAPADREPLRKTLISDDYLTDASERGFLVLDGEGKDSTIALVA